MIRLFFEIKRNTPKQISDSLKISEPYIGDKLVRIHYISNNFYLKSLIERFLTLAGDDWIHQITPLKKCKITNQHSKKILLNQLINNQL